MEVAPSIHAASLLASLNLQRERAQLCDCVVRQRHNPGQLYPAHRCILAASSPVLASILSSAGALVELQAPCLSDSVLPLVLDYIYTGVLPYSHSQQQYSSLLTAACYLQMGELQETLRTKVNAADNTIASAEDGNQPYRDNNDTCSKTVNMFSKYLPLSDTYDADSLEREHQYWDELDSCRSNSKSVSPLSNVSTSCSGDKSTGSSTDVGNCRQVTYLAPQDLIQSVPCTTEVHEVSRGDKEVQKDHFHSAGTIKPESWHVGTEEERVRTAESRGSLFLLPNAEMQEEQKSRVEKTVESKAEENQTNQKAEDNLHHSPLLCVTASHVKDSVSPSRCPLSPAPSSSHKCCGAVPVIRHGSTAAMAEVSTVPPYHTVAWVSVSSTRAPYSQSGSTYDDRIGEGVITKHKDHYGAPNQHHRNNEDHIGQQNWNYKNSSDQCAIQHLCYKSHGILKQDYNGSGTEHDTYMGIGLSHTADHDDHAHSDSIQNHPKHLTDHSVPPNKDCSSFIRGFKYKTDFSFDHFASKYQKLDCSDCHNVSMTTPALHSQDPRAAVSLLEQDSDKGSDTHHEDLYLEAEVNKEHSYSSVSPAQMDRKDSICDPCGAQDDCCPNLLRAEMSTKDAASSQHERDSKDTAMVNVVGHTSLEHENISEPHEMFTVPTDDNVSGPMYNVVGQSYHGHLHYQCLPQENTLLPRTDSDHRHSRPTQSDHSDQCSDEEEIDTFVSPGLSPLRQHFSSTDQVLLLDIGTKPAELLVSYRHRSEEREDTSGNGLVVDDRVQQHEVTSIAGADGTKITARTKFGERLDEAGAKTWTVERNGEKRKSVCNEKCRPGPEVIHKAGVKEGANQTTSLTLCSLPSVPDSIQAPVSTALSSCIPSTLSASMPANISAPLSVSVHHPFQCSLCDRSFSQRGSLNRHVRSHLGVRPFPCPRCPMTFSRQYRVIEHMRVHQRCVLGNDIQNPPASSV
uniref:uncharacterized protein LOC124056207 n=1 Tax=Scatophagus argus TaxID=75038 RepID=UPI001ED80722|nr:uncharacterized protein LOC124056207 [Scatophagus argus]